MITKHFGWRPGTYYFANNLHIYGMFGRTVRTHLTKILNSSHVIPDGTNFYDITADDFEPIN